MINPRATRPRPPMPSAMTGLDIKNGLFVAQSRTALAAAAMRAIARPIGAVAIDIDLYGDADRGKRITAVRWAVAKFRWDGDRWRRARKLTGPLTFDQALAELEFHSNRFGQSFAGQA